MHPARRLAPLPSALLIVLALAAAAAPAAATPTLIGVDPPQLMTLTARGALDRDCTVARQDGATVHHQWIAPADGELAVRLTGARDTGDWDLAVFETISGKRVGSSAGFGADEIVTLTVGKGASLALQACRRSGAANRIVLRTQLTRLDLSGVKGQRGTISLVDVPLADRGALARLEATGLDVTHDVDQDSAKVLSYGDDDLATLRRSGFGVRTVIRDVAARAQRPASPTHGRTCASPPRRRSRPVAPRTAGTRTTNVSSRRSPRRTRRSCVRSP